MGRIFVLVLLLASTLAASQFAPPRDLTGQQPTPVVVPTDVSFNKDVLPILQKDCQTCHRPGEAGPMSFMTYESARPWAKAIKQAVVTQKMPPWFAEPGFNNYRNDPTLTPQEIAILSAWADAGAPEGDAKDKPRALQFTSGWRIDPDVVVSIPEAHAVPAKGSGEIKVFNVPNPFPQDTWVSAIEVRPGNASVVHHVMVQVPEDLPQQQQFSWGAGATLCTAALSPTQGFSQSQIAQQAQNPSQAPTTPGVNTNIQNTVSALLNGGQPQSAQPVRPPRNFAILEAVYAPGSAPMDFTAYNSAKLIQGGGQLRIEVHYTPNGTATTDQTRVGFKVAKTPPQYRYITLAPRSLANTRQQIPAGHPYYETRGELEFGQDAQLVWLMPHMHLRGKDMSFRLVGTNGDAETLLNAQFNFNWQLGYELQRPVRVRRGAQLQVVAHHDNSANNKFNPNPNASVGWGDLTEQEMVLPWFGVIVNPDADPEKILSVRQSSCSNPLGILPGVPAVRVPGVVPTFPAPITR
jgi:hypothetical protein